MFYVPDGEILKAFLDDCVNITLSENLDELLHSLHKEFYDGSVVSVTVTKLVKSLFQ